MRPSRQPPSSLSQRVQRHSGFWVVGLVFAPVGQLEGAGWREGKGVGIGMLLYVEHPNCIRESSTDDPSKHQ